MICENSGKSNQVKGTTAVTQVLNQEYMRLYMLIENRKEQENCNEASKGEW